MNDFFKGKKRLVVGGTSGMGLETARMVLKAGGSVVLTGSKQDKADAVYFGYWNALATFGKIDVAVSPTIAQMYGIRAVPSLAVRTGSRFQ